MCKIIANEDNFAEAGKVLNIPQEDQERIRLYLLGELTGSDEEAVELRLLTDAEFAEELELVEEEMVDQYAGGDLAQPERTRLERRFFDSPERRRKLRVALALRGHAVEGNAREKKASLTSIGERRPQARFTLPPRYFKVAAVLLAAIGLGATVWWLRAGGSDIEQGMAALNEAFKSRRTIESRVTAIGYAPLIVTRGPEGASVDPLARRRAERLLLDAVESGTGPQSHHALGRFYLLDAQFGKAVEQLEQTLRHSPGDAQAHSDMGAALLELGRQQAAAGDQAMSQQTYGRALEHVNTAAGHDASLLEPLFNRALILEYQGLPEQAKEAWRQYLTRDSQSKWAEDARGRLKLLNERAAAQTKIAET